LVIAYQSSLIDNDIDTQIDAGASEIISAVTCTLGGFALPSDDLSPNPVVAYHRTQVGDAEPSKTESFNRLGWACLSS
jgi:hypothetical protein